MSIINVPISDFSAEALTGLLEEYVSRDGTDYGEVEVPIDEKTKVLRKQLEIGELSILFDPETQELDIVMREQMENFGAG